MEEDCTWRCSAETGQRRPFLLDVLLFKTLSVSLLITWYLCSCWFCCREAADSVTECLYRLVKPSSVSWFFSELLRITAPCPKFIFESSYYSWISHPSMLVWEEYELVQLVGHHFLDMSRTVCCGSLHHSRKTTKVL